MRAHIHDGQEPMSSTSRPDTLVRDQNAPGSPIFSCNAPPVHTFGSCLERLCASITRRECPKERTLAGMSRQIGAASARGGRGRAQLRSKLAATEPRSAEAEVSSFGSQSLRRERCRRAHGHEAHACGGLMAVLDGRCARRRRRSAGRGGGTAIRPNRGNWMAASEVSAEACVAR
jgi:hypothetical protein